MMNSREKILSAVKKNQPTPSTPPELEKYSSETNPYERFKTTLINIGGAVIEVKNWDDIGDYVLQQYSKPLRIVNTIPSLTDRLSAEKRDQDPHLYADVTLTIIQGHFGVAENGAIWVTDELMGDRALPYITEHLSLVIKKESIVPTLHEAYEKIGTSSYNLGAFIAGPSKTADIEQALVLGAHGAKSLVVFVMTI